MEVLIVVLIIFVVFLAVACFQQAFKIGYYETRLENYGADIKEVKEMPFYKLWLN